MCRSDSSECKNERCTISELGGLVPEALRLKCAACCMCIAYAQCHMELGIIDHCLVGLCKPPLSVALSCGTHLAGRA